MLYALNPYASFRISTDNNIACVVGRGDDRSEVKFDNSFLLDILLQLRVPKDKNDIVLHWANELDIEHSEAIELVDEFINDNILTQSFDISKEALVWEDNGWRDALEFHLACESLTFDANLENVEKSMQEYLSNSKQGVDIGLAPSYKTYPDNKSIILNNSFAELSNTSLGETIDKYKQVNAFKDLPISFTAFSEFINISHGVVTELETTIGNIIFRTSPSGGSLHPIDAYIIINNVENIEKGLYHYNCKENSVELLKQGDFRDEITGICHEKNGIRTASFVLIHTCRWARHIWKYRYSRSYRMVHFDLGHIIQTSVLVAQALGIGTFHNPAINDKKALDFLGLKDDCEEGVLFSLGFGILDY